MIAIYSDSDILDREWIPKVGFFDSHLVFHSIADYLTSTADHHIAFTAQRLHADHDTDLRFEDKIRKLSDRSDLVFSLESELHQFHWSIWRYCQGSNVYWLQPGTVNDHAMKDFILPWQDWFKTTSNLYRKFTDVLDSIRPYDTKPKSFDALLGSPKPHRDFVRNSVAEHDLADQFIMPYGGQWSNQNFYAQDYFIFEPGTEIIDPLIGTCDWVQYRGEQCHLSQIIPVNVYNQTAYSIVAETDADNTLSFFSEKTAKPLIARRLFVAFSGYHFLHNLRELGFQTFGSVIDESYDDIFNSKQRYHAAFQQVRRLCEMDQRMVLEKIRPVLEHNHRHIMQTDWTEFALGYVREKIKQKVFY